MNNKITKHHDALSVTILDDPSGLFDCGCCWSWVSVQYGVRYDTLPNGIILLYEPERGKHAGSCVRLMYYNRVLYNVTVWDNPVSIQESTSGDVG